MKRVKDRNKVFSLFLFFIINLSLSEKITNFALFKQMQSKKDNK